MEDTGQGKGGRREVHEGMREMMGPLQFKNFHYPCNGLLLKSLSEKMTKWQLSFSIAFWENC